MEIGEFQSICTRTCQFENEHEFLYGLIGEVGEVVDLLKKITFHSHPINKENISLELGDVLWYINNLATIYDIDMNDVCKKNIEKLKKRYPTGFSTADSIRRVDNEED